jgi:hypothetical protein
MEHLRLQANWFRRQGRLQDDKMETIIEELKNDMEADRDREQDSEAKRSDKHKRVMEVVDEGLLQVDGIAPNSKQDEIFRLMCENANGFNSKINRNSKIAKALDIKDDLGIDCLMYCKQHLNLQHKENKNDFKQMFQQEIACTAVAAHNTHEGRQAGRVQEGGTGAVCFGDATGYIKKVGKDEEGLGRWSWILFGGLDGHNIRLITAYNSCKNKNVNSGISYQCRYFIMKKKDLTRPLTLFRQHLTTAWRAAGDRIVLFMDHNEHVYDGALDKALSDREGLNLSKVILKHTGLQTGAMFFWGSKPINGLWASSNLDISNACVMLFGYGVGDHCTFILDIQLESLVGENPVKIVQPASCRLNSRLPGCGNEYIRSLETNTIHHHLLECQHDAHTENYMPKERARKVIIINEEGKAYMQHAEKCVQKFNLAGFRSPPRLLFGSGKFRYTTLCSNSTKGGLRIAGTLSERHSIATSQTHSH